MSKKEKEKYQVWWEYLKLSDDYKNYCSKPFIHRLKKAKIRNRPPKLVPPLYLYIDVESGELPGDIFETYETFGDVHSSSFEDFWNKKGKFLKNDDKNSIHELRDSFPFLCSWYETFHLKLNRQKKSWSSFKSYLEDTFTLEGGRLFLEIDIYKPIGKIKKEFDALLNSHLKKSNVAAYRKKTKWAICRNRVYTPNLRLDEVKRYLEVLKIYKIEGLRGKAAFKAVNPKGNYDDSDEVSAFHSDRRKGKRIVKNVEKGFFPGKY